MRTIVFTSLIVIGLLSYNLYLIYNTQNVFNCYSSIVIYGTSFDRRFITPKVTVYGWDSAVSRMQQIYTDYDVNNICLDNPGPNTFQDKQRNLKYSIIATWLSEFILLILSILYIHQPSITVAVSMGMSIIIIGLFTYTSVYYAGRLSEMSNIYVPDSMFVNSGMLLTGYSLGNKSIDAESSSWLNFSRQVCKLFSQPDIKYVCTRPATANEPIPVNNVNDYGTITIISIVELIIFYIQLIFLLFF